MKLLKVVGNNTKKQKVIGVDIVGSLKSSNQTNPRSGGTTLVQVGVLMFGRSEKGKKLRKDSMK